ncbi:MAG: TfoX family protein [Comamonadaceae bacterium]|nr:MAG: TfoX family protein [Comamonadaceae bacterium]
MTSPKAAFATYCCELLSQAVGPCVIKRMFGGYGISTGNMNIAIVVDLGEGETLWLKSDAEARGLYEAAGCRQFTYLARGEPRSIKYYAAPDEAMESPQLMAQWGRVALGCALKAREKPRSARAGSRSVTTPPSPKASRPKAPPARPSARRRSTSG